MYLSTPTSADSPLFEDATVFTSLTCCINKSQYNRSSDFLYRNESSLTASEDSGKKQEVSINLQILYSII